jgi:Flp pilus assembly pilin Flp
MAAIAVAVFTAYSRMGNDVASVVNKVNTDLTTAS